jgi:hypothetical protein
VRTKAVILSCATLLAAAPAAEAHHSRAMFEIGRAVELTGTVRQFQWTNPHCYIQLVVTGADGTEQEWSLEMGAPMHLQGRGWGPRTVKAGDRIRVTIFPLRNGRPGGELQAATTLGGRPLGKVS